MSEEKVYPAIYKAVDGNTFVYLDVKNYYSIERECWDVSNGDDNHATDTNITHEYLQNTYGEVVSPEHAEFIAKLCKAHDIKVISSIPSKCSSFLILSPGNIYFYENDISESFEGEPIKLITTPLPPKQIQTATPGEDFEMTQIEKNNDDNLMFGCADKCEEWPCVNDEVQTSFGKGVVKLLPDIKGCYVILIDGVYFQLKLDEIKKPKTPEEELRDDIRGIIAESILGNKTNGEITNILIDKYNIKPQ